MKTVTGKELWSGRVLSAIAVLFLLLDGVTHVLQLQDVVAWHVQLGYPAGTTPVIGVLLLVGIGLYLVPRTSIYGLIWLTAYLGGAVATQLRIDSPLLTRVLFPCYVAVLLWLGLALRHPRLRALLLGRE